MTYLWQEERGTKFYKVQTDEKAIIEKLKRRKGFTLAANGINCALRIYDCEFTRPDIARKTLKSITGKRGEIDLEGVLRYE